MSPYDVPRKAGFSPPALRLNLKFLIFHKEISSQFKSSEENATLKVVPTSI